MTRLKTLSASLFCLLCFGGISPLAAMDPETTTRVYIEQTPDDGVFSAMLAVELSKRKGLIKRVRISVVDSPDKARYIFRPRVDSRSGKWHEGWLTPSRATAMAAILVYDRCGQMVWHKTKGDNTLFGAAGPQHTASKVALSFKEAVSKKKSRLNRAPPCLVAGDEAVPEQAGRAAP